MTTEDPTELAKRESDANDSLTILLIEDDEVDVLNVRRAFKIAGIESELLVAGNGLEAMRVLRQNPPSKSRRMVLMTDLNMPQMDGLELMREIRQDANLRRLPVVVLTTSDRPSDRQAAFDLYAAGYLVKPTKPQALVDVVKRVQEYWEMNRFSE